MQLVGIIGAMEQEVALLKQQMSNISTISFGSFEFYRGQLQGTEVVLVQCGIGKVASAIATTLMISQFQPDCVINTGSAGGFDAELAVGDIVISTELRHHDVDVTAFGYEPGHSTKITSGL